MRKFGYARVSTNQQSLDIQILALEKEGVSPSRIFTDKETGSKLDREGLNLLRVKVEEGDVVLVKRLDRLGRNTLHMLQLVEEFDRLGVAFRFLEGGLSTEGPTGKLMLTIFSAIAEADRSRILENTNEGRVAAQLKGIKFGRKRSVDREKVIRLSADRYGPTEIAKQMGIGRSTVHAILKDGVRP